MAELDQPKVGDKVFLDGMVTLKRVGAWRKTVITSVANCTLMEEHKNGMWEVEIPDLGRALVHRTAISYPRMVPSQPWGTLVVSDNRRAESDSP